MNKIAKFKKKLPLFVFFIAINCNTASNFSLLNRLNIASIKNKSLFFILGAGSILSFVIWKMCKSKQKQNNELLPNKSWLENELNILESNFNKNIRYYQTIKNNTIAINNKSFSNTDLTIEIADVISDNIQLEIKKFIFRYEKKYKYSNKKINILSKKLQDCFGESGSTDHNTWIINFDAIKIKETTSGEGIGYYFFILNTFLHEFAHAVNIDFAMRNNLKTLTVETLINISRHQEWQADQFFALQDKEAAEILFMYTMFFCPDDNTDHSKSNSKLHVSENAKTLRAFDIAKNHNLIPNDIIKGKRNFMIKDIEPILTKHNFSASILTSIQWERVLTVNSNFYHKHKNDTEYMSIFNDDKNSKISMNYPRNINFV